MDMYVAHCMCVCVHMYVSVCLCLWLCVSVCMFQQISMTLERRFLKYTENSSYRLPAKKPFWRQPSGYFILLPILTVTTRVSIITKLQNTSFFLGIFLFLIGNRIFHIVYSDYGFPSPKLFPHLSYLSIENRHLKIVIK